MDWLIWPDSTISLMDLIEAGVIAVVLLLTAGWLVVDALMKKH